MEAMKAIAEVHSKSQMAGGPAADPASPVITQQPNDADGEAGMEDINLTIEDGETAELETKPGDSSSDAIELKDMLNNSRDDSGISGDVLTTDLGQFDDDQDPYSNLHSETIDLKSDNDMQPNAETELEQTCDTQNSQKEHLPEVHRPIPEIVNSEHSGDTNIADDINIAADTKTEDDTVDGSVKQGETIKVDDNTIKSDDNTTKADDNTTKADDNTTKADDNTTKADDNTIKADDNTIAEVQLNQNIKGYEVEATVEIPPDRKLEEVASITSEGSEVTAMTTGSVPQPASLDIDLSLDGISTCSFDPEAEVADVRSSGDGKVDQVSLVDVKVEVKDEMALLSKAIAEVQLEDGKLFEAKVKYQRELREARLKLYRMYKTYRQAIEKTKPYYVAKELEKEMKAELDQTETDAERAKLNFEAAKETEAIAMDAMSNTKAELGSIGQGSEGREAMDNWNQATARVLQTSKLRAEIEDRLRRKEEQFLQAERSANALFLDLKKFIEKAWPYYAMKDQYTRTLEKTRREIRESGQKLAAAKEKYQETFSRLNLVATEIHQKKTITDRQSGRRANDNFSQFEEIHDIDTVLSSLESRAENLSTCLDGLDDDEEGDIEAELTIMPKSKSLFSMGRSNTRESMDEILDAKKVLGEKGRRKTLAQINF